MCISVKRFFQVVFVLIFSLLAVCCSKQDAVRQELKDQLLLFDGYSQKSPKKALQKMDSLLLYMSGLTKSEKALLLFEKGEVYYLNDQYQQALSLQLKAYELFLTLKDDYNSGRSLITLSAACLKLREFESAQEYAVEALRIGELLGNLRLQAKANNQLFLLHFRLKDYAKALMYIEQTDRLFASSTDTTSLIATKGNIATIYLRLKQYNKALKNYSKALALGQSIKDPKTIVRVLNNIGYTYIEVKDFKSAEKFLRGAVTLNKNIKAVNAAPYKGLGAMFLVKNELGLAKKNYKIALDIYHEKKVYSEEIDVLDKLISIAILTEDYQEALNHQIIRDRINLHVKNKEKEQLLHFANVKYELKQQEEAFGLQENINNKNRLLLGSIIVSLVLLIVIFGFFNYNSKLRAANKTTLLEQRLLRAQMNPHFIFNTLAAIQNITLEGDPVRSSNYIAKFSKLIRQNFDYVRKEEISLKEELAMISNYIQTQQLRFNNIFEYEVSVDESIDLISEKVPPMLLQPFLENAIEYGLKEKNGGGFLSLKIRKDQTDLIFEVVDNGVGRSAKAKESKVSEDLHATDIFLERLQIRGKGEEKTFQIQDLFDENKKSAGTKVAFKLKRS